MVIAKVVVSGTAIRTVWSHKITKGMVGAKVDGRIVSIDYEVKTGEVVEILTTSAPNHGPSRDWLQLVKTSEARNKIRSWYKRERREETSNRAEKNSNAKWRAISSACRGTIWRIS